MDTPEISVVICTFNRPRILAKCLEALSKVETNYSFEVLIVDNCPSFPSKKVFELFKGSFDQFFYFLEQNTGLCHARNNGLKASRANWVVYIDDDTFVRPDYIEEVVLATKAYDFQCFGGKHYAYYLQEKPKWIPKGFGEAPTNHLDEVLELTEEYNTGLSIAFEKKTLESIGGFDPAFGMKGLKIGYSDESIIQFRMKQLGYKIGFIPTIVVDHLVRSDKLTLKWHLKAKYALGRDGREMHYSEYNLAKFIYQASWIILITLPKNLLKLILIPNYYWGDFLLNTIGPIMIYAGRLDGARLLS